MSGGLRPKEHSLGGPRFTDFPDRPGKPDAGIGGQLTVDGASPSNCASRPHPQVRWPHKETSGAPPLPGRTAFRLYVRDSDQPALRQIAHELAGTKGPFGTLG